ncbi:MAG: aminotransferase class V-fold PLP-dependent enzyme [Gemmatimonadetes bacterium]|nr:aminotransferase class V-fold PLP-dependent enzyme [Gemmatimonadota bacterium]
MNKPDLTLEPSADEMRRLARLAMDRIVEHIETLPTQPAADTAGGADLARSLKDALPELGSPFEELLDLLYKKAAPKSFNAAGPGYLAYIPGGGLFLSGLADFMADTLNRYVGVWEASPGLVQLEANVIRWLCDIVGYPAGAGGFLTSGGSLANFSAVVTARRLNLPEDFLKGTLYCSSHTHSSVHRAAMLAGFPATAVREVPVDGRFCMQVDDLERRIVADRKAGLNPFFLVASAGTTNTGAVDDIPALVEIARREKMWLHVDAAYGGFFVLTERGRATLKGIVQADSVTLDPHKGMFLPYGTGCLIVRDATTLKKAHGYGAEYLPAVQSDPDFVDFNQISPELTRAFRGLRLWLPLKLHGFGPFRKNLDEKLDLTVWAADQLRAMPGMEMLAEPQLSIIAFRLNRPGFSTTQLNDLNKKFLAGINRRNRIFLSGTMLGDRFALRICVLSFRTHMERMKEGMDDIRAAAVEAGQV